MSGETQNIKTFISQLRSLRLLSEEGQGSKDNGSFWKDMMEAQQRLEQIIELLPDATLVINLQGEVVYWNKAMQEMTGVAKDQIIGRGNYEYAIPFYGERRPILIDIALNEGKEQELQGKYDFIGRDEETLSGEVYVPKTYGGKGAYLWGYASKLYDRQGNLYGAIQSIRDISDRKKAEEDLRLAEERFGKAFMASPIPLSISTLAEGTYLDVNDSFLQATGYLREEVIGRSSKELRLWPDANQRDQFFQRLRDGEKLRNLEIRFTTKLGQERLAQISMERIEIGGEDCAVIIFIDITEKKELEKDIARLDRLNLIGQMAASIGHEIRNPMTAVRGFIQMLNEQECYAKDQAFFEVMIEELDRANDIISEYLSMANNKIVNLRPQYLDQVVKAISPIIEANAIYKGINVRLNLGKPPMPVIDDKEIRQMILNLSNNGIEAMSEGGILTIGTDRTDQEIILFVQDQGPGLDEEVIEKLGTPFLTTKDKGTGLGLAVCYSIAARHHARIDFETGPAGTTFKVFFPIPDKADIESEDMALT